MKIIRYLCTEAYCSFCTSREEDAEKHAEQYGENHDILYVEFDRDYNTGKMRLIDNKNVRVS